MPGNPLVDLTADRDDLREGYGPYAKDEDVECVRCWVQDAGSFLMSSWLLASLMQYCIQI